jgi:putative oxidoreductase
MSILHRAIALYDRGTAVLLTLDSLPLAVARITVGWVMIESGWGKLGNLPAVTEYFRELGIPAPEVQAPFAAGSELLFGATLLLGLFTRLSAVPLMIIMTVAILTAKRADLTGFSDLLGFIEYLYIALLLVLFVRGGGAWSLDRLLVWRRSRCAHQREATTNAAVPAT